MVRSRPSVQFRSAAPFRRTLDSSLSLSLSQTPRVQDLFDIPILRRAYELYKTFHGFRSLVSKADRYTLWQRAENLILDVLEGILLASQLFKSEKLPQLEHVSAKLNVLRVFLRLAKDTKLLDLKKCLLLQEIVDEIGRMLGGWMKSVQENKNSPSSGSLRGSS